MDKRPAPPEVASDDAVARLRVPPHSIEAEQSVLGALLLDNDALDRVLDLLSESDFYRHEHRLIYRVMAELISACKPADVITVNEQLQKVGGRDVQSMDLLPYLNSMASSVAGAFNIRAYAKIVRERSIRRSIIALSDRAATLAFSDDGEIADKVDRVATMFADLQEHHTREIPEPVRDLMVKTIEEIQDLSEGKVGSAWPTGFDDIDAHLNGGFRPGEVVVLAARPSVGKSSLAAAISHNFSKSSCPVVFLSQEMPKRQCAMRLIANVGGIELSKLKTGQMNDIEWSIFSEAVDQIRDLPLYFDDEPALTIAAIHGKVGARRREKPKLLVVDFIQECAGDGIKGENRDRELGKIMQGLKTIAKRMGMAVLVLSQLNREVENRSSPVPTMRDLRDSGSIEQSADIVIFIWEHPTQYLGYKVIGGQIAKNRDGERYVWFALEFNRKCQRWSKSDVNVRPGIKSAASGAQYNNQPDNDM